VFLQEVAERRDKVRVEVKPIVVHLQGHYYLGWAPASDQHLL
jgi:hypothetical protein